MTFLDRLRQWEGMIFGFVVGIAFTVVASMAFNELNGFLSVSQWKRSLHNRQLDKLAQLMEEELRIAMTAMDDATPLQLSHYLATQFMPQLYAHHMKYAETLLKKEAVDTYNALRLSSPFLTFDLANKDFSGLNLRGADFAGADLTATDFTEANLEDASFWLAEMPRSNLTRARVSRANFTEAILSSSIMTEIRGEAPSFEKAVLVDASMVRLEELAEANFESAELAQANLFASKFPDARFDGADFTMASAVGSDFAQVQSMNDVNLTGANLKGARIDPDRSERAWFVNADGIPSNVVSGLRRLGGVARPEEVLQKVDPRIIAGFRAQIEEDDSIRPHEREGVLLVMLQEYYLR
ncbi:MAG: pentapeptide repeat-containing protein [Holophagae bacterium]|jgi:uncharacterized protein YjbI with pentapeptide repeats